MKAESYQIKEIGNIYFPVVLCHIDELPSKNGMKIIAILMEAAKGNLHEYSVIK